MRALLGGAQLHHDALLRPLGITFSRAQNRMPAIVSSGQDKTFDASPLGGDDLYSYRVRRIGNRGD